MKKRTRVWFDILTPKQVLFFQPMADRLKKEKNCQVLCTSRNYREATRLAKLKRFNVTLVGRHGGSSKSQKLKSSIKRMDKLTDRVENFKPDVTISYCSPEASRISFGLGTPHIAFCNSPHATAVMKLSVPLLDKLLCPWIISKKEFSKFGIEQKDIIHYKALDEYTIVNNYVPAAKNTLGSLRQKTDEKIILFRSVESQAAYVSGSGLETTEAIQEISNKFKDHRIVVLGRYSDEIKKLKTKLGAQRITVLDDVVDNSQILSVTDVFVGSGGTMTKEAALRGIPTISYEAVPNQDERYVVDKGLVRRAKTTNRIIQELSQLVSTDKNKKTRESLQKRAKTMMQSMEDPYDKLLHTINGAIHK